MIPKPITDGFHLDSGSLRSAQDPHALRQHLLSIATAGLRAVDGRAATAHALATLPEMPALREASRHGRLLVVAAGKPSAAMIRGLLNAGLVPARGVIATPFHDEAAARAAGSGRSCVNCPLRRRRRHPHPPWTRQRRRGGSASAVIRCRRRRASKRAQHALALARGAAPGRSPPRSAFRRRIGAPRRARGWAHARRQDEGDARAARRRRGDSRVERRAQAPVGDQGRTPGRGGAVSGDDAGDLGRDFTGGRRPQRDRLGADRGRRLDVRRCARV